MRKRPLPIIEEEYNDLFKRYKKSFNQQPVLKGINLKIAKGEVVTILGPSGSGKTTLLRCLNFLEKPDEGMVQVGDIQVKSKKATKGKSCPLEDNRRWFFSIITYLLIKLFWKM